MIHITEHDSKMAGIRSISTSTMLNPNCRKNALLKGAICAKCYAKTYMELRPALRECLEANTKALTERILDESELPVITDEVFRFESFGDLNNEIQLENYMNIVKKNPKVQFALWSKQYNLVYNYFKEHDVPENLNLLLSSLMINIKINIDKFKSLGKFRPGQVKVFTVYDKDYIISHPFLDINCGSKNCFGCKHCYLRNDIEEINEILKSDQEAVAKATAYRHISTKAIEDLFS